MSKTFRIFGMSLVMVHTDKEIINQKYNRYEDFSFELWKFVD